MIPRLSGKWASPYYLKYRHLPFTVTICLIERTALQFTDNTKLSLSLLKLWNWHTCNYSHAHRADFLTHQVTNIELLPSPLWASSLRSLLAEDICKCGSPTASATWNLLAMQAVWVPLNPDQNLWGGALKVLLSNYGCLNTPPGVLAHSSQRAKPLVEHS
jgi:hypothetical protein